MIFTWVLRTFYALKYICGSFFPNKAELYTTSLYIRKHIVRLSFYSFQYFQVAAGTNVTLMNIVNHWKSHSSQSSDHKLNVPFVVLIILTFLCHMIGSSAAELYYYIHSNIMWC